MNFLYLFFKSGNLKNGLPIGFVFYKELQKGKLKVLFNFEKMKIKRFYAALFYLVFCVFVAQGEATSPPFADFDLNSYAPETNFSKYHSGKKKRPKKRSSGNRSKGGKRDSNIKMLNGDLFVGAALNYASGNFIEFQNEFYQSRSELFPSEIKTNDFKGFTFGGQFRVHPILNQGNFLEYIGFSIGLSYLRRGFGSEFVMQNLGLDYTDKTSISETYKANFLSTPILFRYGGKLYLDVGPSFDWFLSGKKNYSLKRSTEGDKAYNGPFNTDQTAPEEKLSSDLIKSGGVSWNFGAGYNITNMFGIRVMGNSSSTFFKEGANMKNLQLSFQATVTFN